MIKAPNLYDNAYRRCYDGLLSITEDSTYNTTNSLMSGYRTSTHWHPCVDPREVMLTSTHTEE